jgi:hypothetical protein
MKSRLAFALVLASSLVPALASAAPRISAVHGKSVVSADPLCGGPKTPEGPQPPKEPPKT